MKSAVKAGISDPRGSRAENFFLKGMVALPVIAVMIWGMGLAIVLNGILPLWVVIPLALLLGFGAVVFFLAGQGNTVFEVVVGSFIAIVMFFCIWPVLMKAKERRLSKRAPVSISAPSTAHPLSGER